MPQLHLNAVDKELFTVAVKDVIKQPLTFTMGGGVGRGGETDDEAVREREREREISFAEMLTCKRKS